MSQGVLRRSTLNIVGFLVVIHLTGTAQYDPSPGKKVKKGDDVVIDCSLKETGGIHWFFQRENAKPEHLLYISNVGKVTPTTNRRLTHKSSFDKLSLTVKSFTKQDSGKYYCVTIKNLEMKFGNMVARYLEEVKTTPKATTAPTTSPTVAPTRKETTRAPDPSGPRRRRCQHQFKKRPMPEDNRRPINNYH
ncbi:T-cell surface glycoprotein CD8 alpha chain-like isoform X2 [Rhinoraja longicauda]